jgi:hypothetical protein
MLVEPILWCFEGPNYWGGCSCQWVRRGVQVTTTFKQNFFFTVWLLDQLSFIKGLRVWNNGLGGFVAIRQRLPGENQGTMSFQNQLLRSYFDLRPLLCSRAQTLNINYKLCSFWLFPLGGQAAKPS